MVEGEILDTDEIAASTVEADGCLGKLADGLKLFGGSFMMSLDPFSLFEEWFAAARDSEVNDPNAMAVATVDTFGMPDVRMASAVHQRLISYRWPGNVRQLENVLERLLVLCSGDLITVEELPEELEPTTASAPIFWQDLPEDGISLEAIERELISRALEKFDGNQTQAARYLDISRRTLIYRMEKHGLAGVDSEVAENPG